MRDEHPVSGPEFDANPLAAHDSAFFGRQPGLRGRFVGRALELMHARPDHVWTVEDLAREVGLSRSALHERFVQYLGHPTMQYLANWRIQLGARLLRESNRTVATIALEVGYESEAAFSRAFKRLVGAPPTAWRKAQTSPQGRVG